MTKNNNENIIPINPLKGKTSNGWHFEQNVYDINGITRSIKAGGGSGNIPKVIVGVKDGKLKKKTL
jgi:DNA (cytosine-5)-methyltransferase 1